MKNSEKIVTINLVEIIKCHPCILYADDMQEICKPLRSLNITYFGHGRINEKGQSTGLSSDPGYLTYYLENKLFNLDLSATAAISKLNYLIWDDVPNSASLQIYYNANTTFCIHHIFTIIEVNQGITDAYHFATNIKNRAMNSFYIENLNLLKQFIRYYQDKMLLNDTLNRAHKIIVPAKLRDITKNKLLLADISLPKEAFEKFKHELHYYDQNIYPERKKMALSRREEQCAYYMVQGYTAKEIADILNISSRTVEVHLDRLKEYFCVKNRVQLAVSLTQHFGRLMPDADAYEIPTTVSINLAIFEVSIDSPLKYR